MLRLARGRLERELECCGDDAALDGGHHATFYSNVGGGMDAPTTMNPTDSNCKLHFFGTNITNRIIDKAYIVETGTTRHRAQDIVRYMRTFFPQVRVFIAV